MNVAMESEKISKLEGNVVKLNLPEFLKFGKLGGFELGIPIKKLDEKFDVSLILSDNNSFRYYPGIQVSKENGVVIGYGINYEIESGDGAVIAWNPPIIKRVTADEFLEYLHQNGIEYRQPQATTTLNCLCITEGSVMVFARKDSVVSEDVIRGEGPRWVTNFLLGDEDQLFPKPAKQWGQKWYYE
jgi:hypothetical protein